MRLSVSMIARNEESCLATALTSVIGADELVVVDTGSFDRTKQIAASFGAVLYDFPWVDDFAAARNFSLSKCTGDWVLIVDADELLEAGGIAKVRAAIERAGDFKTIGVQVVAKTNGETHVFPRLFKRCPEVFWKGAIHNHLSVSETNPSDVRIFYGYSEAHKADPDRALRILTKELERDPQLVRETYYLAREHWYRKDYATAAKWYTDYLTRGTWPPEVADAWLMLARCRWALRQGDAARAACVRAIGVNANFKEAIVFMAQLCGPKNRARWAAFAEGANNDSVLFVRAAATPAATQATAAQDVERKAGVFYPHGNTHRGKFTAGAGCVFHNGMAIDCTGDVTIGDHCMMLRGVKIYTHDHAFLHGEIPDVTKERGLTQIPLFIGSNVSICEDAVILPGVRTIGNDAVIGHSAVVTKPVGPGEIWAGNPARLIGRRDDHRERRK